MESKEEVEEPKPVGGLMDRHVIAALTGAKPNTVRQWANRAAGTQEGAPPAWFPPIIGKLNGAPVFSEKDLDLELAKASLRNVPGRAPKARKAAK